MRAKRFIGIDGGASKTAGALIGGNGEVLARARTRGSAIVGRPSPESLETLSAVVAELTGKAGAAAHDVARVGIGLNGVDFEDETPMQAAEIACALGMPDGRITLVNDGIAALWGATTAPAAVILQHGSGVTAAYRSEHGREHLFDHLNVGKLFDLRMAAIALVARMIDGRENATSLKKAILEHLGLRFEPEYAEAVFRKHIPLQRQLSVASVVFDQWQNGDPAAVSLVERALEDYARTASAMIRKTACADVDAVFGGGVIAHAPAAVWTALEEKVRARVPAANVRRPALPPEFGAALMAAFLEGMDIGTVFRRMAEEQHLHPEVSP